MHLVPRPPKGSKKWNPPNVNPLLHWGTKGIIKGFHFLDPLGGLGQCEGPARHRNLKTSNFTMEDVRPHCGLDIPFYDLVSEASIPFAMTMRFWIEATDCMFLDCTAVLLLASDMGATTARLFDHYAQRDQLVMKRH